jgi:putative ABC transport system permease protein
MTALADRPEAAQTASRQHGGGPARRAIIRWAWRLFRREWRQQLLVLALLIVAVGATTVMAAVAANAPSSPAATFGTANLQFTLQSPGKQLAADLAATRQRFGTIDVIEHQSVPVPGSVNTTDLRAQDPRGPFGYPMLQLDAGHYPSGPGQVAVTGQVAAIYRLRLGSVWREDGHARTVVGLVENPLNLQDSFALVAPGQAAPPSQVQVLLNATPAQTAGFTLPDGSVPSFDLRTNQQSNFPPSAVLVFTVIGLLFVGLLAVAGFAVMASRRLRALGMLAAVGASVRQVRLGMVANGVIIGIAAAISGLVVGLASWLAFVPRLQTIAEHRIDWLHLPLLVLAAGMLLAVAAAVAAAWWPAQAAARVPVVAALSGRPPRPRPGHQFAAVGGVLLVVGLGLLGVASRSVNGHHGTPMATVGGVIGTAAGVLLLGPLAIRGLAAAGRRSPVSVRIALRDLVRYQARSGAALAAVSLTIGIAAAIAVGAAEPQATAGPSTGNLPANQLIAYISADADPSADGGGPIPVPTAAEVTSAQRSADGLAASLHTTTILALETAALASSVQPLQGQSGTGLQPASLVRRIAVTINGRSGVSFSPPPNGSQLYVATPVLLQHYGIVAGSIKAGADILTSIKGLAGYGLTDFANMNGCGGPSCVVRRRQPGVPRASLPGLAHPIIEQVDGLPAYTSAPNTLITATAIRSLGLTVIPVGWLIQTPRPLTSAQIVAADHWAAAIGLTVETRNGDGASDSGQLATDAAAIAALLALGVLAMTAGLIRSETAPDLRILTATGAGGATRRSIASASAASLGLLGALIGTGGAYLAFIAWHHGVRGLGHVPVTSLLIILAGLPVLAAAGGWLLAGREPAAIARQPLV